MSKKFGMTYGGGIVYINNASVVKSRVPTGFSPESLEADIQKIL